MSAINGITANTYPVSQTSGTATLGQVSPAGDSDGDNDGSQGSFGVGRGGRFAAAIVQALSSIGVTVPTPATTGSSAANASDGATSAGTGTSASQDVQKALSTFMHDLFSALHAARSGSNAGAAATSQAANAAGTDSDGDNDGSGSVAGAQGYHHHGGGLQRLTSGLQSLIQQLSSTDSTSTTTTDASSVGTVDATAGGSTSSTDGSALQQDFSNLLASLGVTNNQTSLADFLSALQNTLQANNPGSNVSTQA